MSAAYHVFYERMTIGGGIPGNPGGIPGNPEVAALLVDDTYTFDATHASMAAITPHAIGDVIKDLVVEQSLIDPSRRISDPSAIGLRATEDVEFADADTSYAVATLKAVVLYVVDDPLLYLDHESFAALPTATLGGAVELHVKSERAFGVPGDTALALASGAWLVEVGP